MTKALAAYHDATYGGVYYSANVDFTDLTIQPTWTKLATTGLANTLVRRMQNDFYTPYDDIYVQLDNDSVYKWNGVSWDLLLDQAGIYAACGTVSGDVGHIYVDKTIAGVVYIPVAVTGAAIGHLLKSTDYGANWTLITITTGLTVGGATVAAMGNYIVYQCGSIYRSLHFSSNGGAMFADFSVWSSTGGADYASFRINRHNGLQAYFANDSADLNLALCTLGGKTVLQNGYNLYGFHIAYDDLHWIDPITANHERIIRIGSGAGKIYIYSTIDQWANFVDSTPSDLAVSMNIAYGAIAAALENSDYSLFGMVGQAAGARSGHMVWGFVGDNPTAIYGIAGTNYATPPYTSAIPTQSDAYIASQGIFVGEAPASTGVYVYADEQGDITAIPNYGNLGTPLFGDRGSWRDRKADGFDIYHAEDVQRDQRQIHAPQPTGNNGYGIIETGSYWVSSGAVLATVGDLHDPVTLDADAAVVLDLTGQEIGLDVQNANTVLAGPTVAPANEPTFRALTLADLPDDAHEHLINVDWTDLCNGVETNFTTSVTFRARASAIYLNGIRQRLDFDYTEDGTYDAITMDVAPETGDILIGDFIISLSDWLSIGKLLLETSDYVLLETGDKLVLEV